MFMGIGPRHWAEQPLVFARPCTVNLWLQHAWQTTTYIQIRLSHFRATHVSGTYIGLIVKAALCLWRWRGLGAQPIELCTTTADQAQSWLCKLGRLWQRISWKKKWKQLTSCGHNFCNAEHSVVPLFIYLFILGQWIVLHPRHLKKPTSKRDLDMLSDTIGNSQTDQMGFDDLHDILSCSNSPYRF